MGTTTQRPAAAPAKQGKPAKAGKQELPGPFAVGDYVRQLDVKLREFKRVQLRGQVSGLSVYSGRVYFELGDERGSISCTAPRSQFSRWRVDPESLKGGVEVLVAGGPAYRPGGGKNTGKMQLLVQGLEVVGAGKLRIALDNLRKQLENDGLVGDDRPQLRLQRPTLPDVIGLITSGEGKARDDLVAALGRRGWGGHLICGFTSVQGADAALRIVGKLDELVYEGDVDVVIVTRGGGSETELKTFSDEVLCRAVAEMPVPVIAAVGHHTDRPLIGDVAAVSCSTPTHAAEEAVRAEVSAERTKLVRRLTAIHQLGSGLLMREMHWLSGSVRSMSEPIARERLYLARSVRELHSLASKMIADDRNELEKLGLVLSSHDVAETLRRGYAMVQDMEGNPIGSAAEAMQAGVLRLRFADGEVPAVVEAASYHSP